MRHAPLSASWTLQFTEGCARSACRNSSATGSRLATSRCSTVRPSRSRRFTSAGVHGPSAGAAPPLLPSECAAGDRDCRPPPAGRSPWPFTGSSARSGRAALRTHSPEPGQVPHRPAVQQTRHAVHQSHAGATRERHCTVHARRVANSGTSATRVKGPRAAPATWPARRAQTKGLCSVRAAPLAAHPVAAMLCYLQALGAPGPARRHPFGAQHAHKLGMCALPPPTPFLPGPPCRCLCSHEFPPPSR